MTGAPSTSSGTPPGVLLQTVIEAPRRLDELSTARVIGEAAELVHKAQKGGQPLGTLVPQAIIIAASGITLAPAAAAATAYTAPERLRGQPGDRRSDVFSLGIVLWEALAHERLFDAATDDARKAAVLDREVQPPSELNANVPAELDAICKKALERDPANRYQSAKVMRIVSWAPLVLVLVIAVSACGRIGFEPDEAGGLGEVGEAEIDDGIVTGICDGAVAGVVTQPLQLGSRIVRPQLSWSGREIGAVWSGGGVWFARLGADHTILAQRRLAPPTTNGPAAIAWNGAGYGVVWVGPGGGDLLFVALDASGALVGAPTTVVAGAGAGAPYLAWMGDRYVLAWEQGLSIFTVSLSASGQPTRAPANVLAGTSGARLDYYYHLTRAGASIALAWTFGCCDGEEYVYAALLDRDGQLLGEGVRLAGRSANEPYVAWTGTELGLIWWDAGMAFGTVSAAGVVGNLQRYPLTHGLDLVWTGDGYVVLVDDTSLVKLDPSGVVLQKIPLVADFADEHGDLVWTTNGVVVLFSVAGQPYLTRACQI